VGKIIFDSILEKREVDIINKMRFLLKFRLYIFPGIMAIYGP